jgi:hypothetical protein
VLLGDDENPLANCPGSIMKYFLGLMGRSSPMKNLHRLGCSGAFVVDPENLRTGWQPSLAQTLIELLNRQSIWLGQLCHLKSSPQRGEDRQNAPNSAIIPIAYRHPSAVSRPCPVQLFARRGSPVERFRVLGVALQAARSRSRSSILANETSVVLWMLCSSSLGGCRAWGPWARSEAGHGLCGGGAGRRPIHGHL